MKPKTTMPMEDTSYTLEDVVSMGTSRGQTPMKSLCKSEPVGIRKHKWTAVTK